MLYQQVVSEYLKHSVRNQFNEVRKSLLECLKVLRYKHASRNKHILHYNLMFNGIKRIISRIFISDI
jgi:hypothetical protein